MQVDYWSPAVFQMQPLDFNAQRPCCGPGRGLSDCLYGKGRFFPEALDVLERSMPSIMGGNGG